MEWVGLIALWLVLEYLEGIDYDSAHSKAIDWLNDLFNHW